MYHQQIFAALLPCVLVCITMGGCRGRATSNLEVAGGIDLGPVDESFPVVRLNIADKEGVSSCTGTILGVGYLLTAAHCITDTETMKPIEIRLLSVMGRFWRIESVAAHPKYLPLAKRPLDEKSPYDLAMVRFSIGAESTEQVYLDLQNAALQLSPREAKVGDAVEFIGYGITRKGIGEATSTPRKGRNVISRRTEALLEITGSVYTAFIRGDVAKDSDFAGALTLSGDSGAPLLLDGKVAGLVVDGRGEITHNISRFVNLHSPSSQAFLREYFKIAME